MKKEESEKLIKELISEEERSFFGFANHRKHSLKSNTFRFSVAILSLDFLISLMEHPEVKNIYFNPTMASPNDKRIDPISLRYKIYVEYKGED